jgi:sugar phosphate isomerase/epimerase
LCGAPSSGGTGEWLTALRPFNTSNCEVVLPADNRLGGRIEGNVQKEGHDVKLGVMSTMYQFVNVPTADYLERFAKRGFKYVDLMTIGDLQLRYLSNEAVDTLRQTMNRLEMVPSCFIANVGGNGASSNVELRDRAVQSVSKAIEVASQLGFPMVLFFPGEKERETPPAKAWENMRSFAEQILRKAEQRRIVLTFENNPRIFRMINSTDETARLLRELPSPFLQATVDIGHFSVIRESATEIRKLAGRVIHAHITDNDGTADTNEALGTGVSPIVECLQELRDAGIDQAARQRGFEPVGVVELNSPEKLSLRSVDSILDRSVEYLQRIASDYLEGI